MHIEFAEADEQYIKESVRNGDFRSEAEAVRSAVRQAREQKAEKRLRLLEALRLGEEDIAAGRTIPYTRDLIGQLYQEAVRNVRSGEKAVYDPNVIP
jgi:Arc/MetJ-type ribon-helix-helix transcriptional regulator